MKWRSRGIDISPIFMHWICRADTLIIPALENKKIPASTFNNAKSLVTIDWSKTFAQKNLNKSVFPNVKTVVMLDSKKIKNYKYENGFKMITGLESGFIKDDRIYWNENLINREWLESQYNEYICAMQEFHRLRENELR